MGFLILHFHMAMRNFWGGGVSTGLGHTAGRGGADTQLTSGGHGTPAGGQKASEILGLHVVTA